MRYLEPTTVGEVSALLGEYGSDAKIVAGGTALVLLLQQGLIAPEALVSLNRVEGLQGVGDADGAIRIGARTTVSEVASSQLVRDQLPSLAYACRRVGNIRVRNAATLGGNMAEADYASDPPAVLASLGASCRAVGPDGERLIPAAEFVTDYYTNALAEDEVVTEILVPKPVSDERAVYLKYISRSSEDRPCVGVAVRARLDGGQVTDLSVVIGAVSGRLQRVPEAESMARGRRLEPGLIDEVAEAYASAIEPMEDLRGSSWYRSRMIEVFVRRALQGLSTPEGAREVMGNAG